MTSLRVMITRDRDRCTELVQRLQHNGITGLPVAHTRVEPTVSEDFFPDLPEQGWLAFTSANAVEIFTSEMRTHGVALPAGLRVAAIGSGTAGFVQRLLEITPLVPEKGNGVSLASCLIPNSEPDSRPEVFWPCAKKVATGFPETLEAAGFRIKRWQLYETILLSPEVLRAELEAIFPWQLSLFTAPSAVAAYHAAFPDPWRTRCLAIGETTAAALKEAGCAKPALCSGVELESIVNSIKADLEKHTVR